MANVAANATTDAGRTRPPPTDTVEDPEPRVDPGVTADPDTTVAPDTIGAPGTTAASIDMMPAPTAVTDPDAPRAAATDAEARTSADGDAAAEIAGTPAVGETAEKDATVPTARGPAGPDRTSGPRLGLMNPRSRRTSRQPTSIRRFDGICEVSTKPTPRPWPSTSSPRCTWSTTTRISRSHTVGTPRTAPAASGWYAKHSAFSPTAEALAELRAARRISGGPGLLAMMADCERGLERPQRAIELARGDESRQLDGDDLVELRIVEAGARIDMGQVDAALVTLQDAGVSPDARGESAARLDYAYAEVLLAAGRKAEAAEWFGHAVAADPEENTDAKARLAELED